MSFTANLRILLLSWVALCAAPAVAQTSNPLVGAWIGTSDDNRGDRVTVGKNFIVVDGDRMPLRFPSPGVMVIGEADEQERVTYALRGDQLTITMDGDQVTWRRAGAGPKPGPGPGPNPKPMSNPLPGPKPNPRPGPGNDLVNPLGGKPATGDPFARKFTGDNVELALTGTAANGYRGTLVFRGKRYPAMAQSRGNELRGTFKASGRDFRFQARLEGDRLTLESGGKQYRLMGERRKAPAPNPLADDAVEGVSPNPLAGNGGEPRPPAPGTRRFVSQKAGVACDLPDGWSTIQDTKGSCTINPGYSQGQTIEATFSLHCVGLEPAQRGLPVDKMMAAELSDFRRELLNTGGIKTENPDHPARLIQVRGKAAATVTMRATTRRGHRGIVWLAVRIEGEKCLVLNAIFINGSETRFLPRVKQVFESLVPASAANPRPADTPGPEANPRPTANPRPAPTGPRNSRSGQRTLRLERRQLTDPGMNGIVSHTVLVPEGWNLRGGVKWTVRHPVAFVHFVASLSAPDGASISSDYNRSFYYSNDPNMLRHKGAPMGGTTRDGTIMMAPPRRHGEAALRVVVPRMRPGATNVRLVSAKTMTEAKQKLEELYAPLIKAMEQNNRMGMGIRNQTWVHVEEARVAYEESGREWEERITYSIVGSHVSIRNEFLQSESGNWQLVGVQTARAPKGQLDAKLPTLVALGRMVKETPRWGIAISQLRRQLQQIRHKMNMDNLRATMERWRLTVKTNNEISDMQMKSWRDQQASSDRVQRMVTNTIRGVSDYKTTDGYAVAIDNTYDRVFQDPAGNLVMTNDPGYDPRTDPSLTTADWTPLEQIQYAQ